MSEPNEKPPPDKGTETLRIPPRLKLFQLDEGAVFPHVTQKLELEDVPLTVNTLISEPIFAIGHFSEGNEIPEVGTLVIIRRSVQITDNKWIITVRGLQRIRIKNVRRIRLSATEKLHECTWEQYNDETISHTRWQEDAIRLKLSTLAKHLHEFLARGKTIVAAAAREQGSTPPGSKKKIIRGILIETKLHKATVQNLGEQLDTPADFILDFLIYVTGGLRPKTVIAFRNLIEIAFVEQRLNELVSLLSTADLSFMPVLSTENLVKFLFDAKDEKEPNPAEKSAAENLILNIPEDKEPEIVEQGITFLSERIIGQPKPIREIARLLNLLLAGDIAENEPLLTAFFAGPSGVGKTELAVALANFLWEREKITLRQAREKGLPAPFSEEDIATPPLVKVPCGIFAGALSHGVADLIGAPAGFTGSRGTQNSIPPVFTQKHFPPNRIVVLLLDELEKAFIDSRSNGAELKGICLEILDKGKIINNWREEIDFTRTIIIGTSNIGSKKIMDRAKPPWIGIRPNHPPSRRLGPAEIEQLNRNIYEDTKKEWQTLFPPELILRFQLFVVFRFLDEENYRAIIQKEFKTIQSVAEKKYKISLALSEAAIEWILDEINGEEGVRRLRQFLKKEIRAPLARAHNLARLKKEAVYEVHPRKITMTRGTESVKEIRAEFCIIPQPGS